MIHYKVTFTVDYGTFEGVFCGDMITFYAISKKPASYSYFLNVAMNRLDKNMDVKNIDLIIDIVHGSELIKQTKTK